MAANMGNSDNHFAITFNHGGQFMKNGGNLMYIGGSMTSSFDLVKDSFEYEDLEFELEMVGYISWKKLYYKVPGKEIYKSVNNDSEVRQMLTCLDVNRRVIQVFVDGGKLGRGDEEEEGSTEVGDNGVDVGDHGVDASAFSSKGKEMPVVEKQNKGKLKMQPVVVEKQNKAGQSLKEKTVVEKQNKGKEKTVVDKQDKGKQKMVVEKQTKGKEKMQCTENNKSGKSVDHHKDKEGMVPHFSDEEAYNSSEDSDYAPQDSEADYTDDDLDDDDLQASEEYSEARRLLREQHVVGISDEDFQQQDIQQDGGEGALSDYEDVDGDIYTSETDEEGDNVSRRSRRIVYDPRIEHRDLRLVLGMRFANGFQAREAIRQHCIADGRDVKFSRVCAEMMEAKCTACDWRVYGAIVKATGHFIIKSLSQSSHTCPTAIMNRQVTSTWIAKQYLNVLRNRPDITAKELSTDIHQRFNCHVNRWKIYHAKAKATVMLRGTVKEHYAKMRSYLLELKRVDPDGRFELYCSTGSVFKGIYVGFSALRNGFKAGCRRVIGLDGAFLKTYLGGVLLCAVATDANKGMFPIAWAVVKVENSDNWRWFLRILVDDLGISTGAGFTFISDQQKGLLKSVGEVTPFATHRNCARHVYMNWKKGLKVDDLKDIFWRTVRSTYLQEYNASLDEMKRVNAAAYENFIARDTTKFCKCFIDPGTVSDMILNNISETFNGYIIKARGKHVIDMLEEVRTSLMERLHRKKSQLNGYEHGICPEVHKEVEKIKRASRYCMVYVASDVQFEVQHYADRFIVDVEQKTCSCRAWDISGIPCVHASAAICYMRREPAEYVSSWYSVEKYHATYSQSLPALNGEKLWPVSEGYPVLPPPVKKMPGRPKKKRKRDPCEADPTNPTKLRRNGSTMTCSNCQKQGHNKRSCKSAQTVKQPKPQGKVGRPKKNPQGNVTSTLTLTLTHANEGSTSRASTIINTQTAGSGSGHGGTKKKARKQLNATQESHS